MIAEQEESAAVEVVSARARHNVGSPRSGQTRRKVAKSDAKSTLNVCKVLIDQGERVVFSPRRCWGPYQELCGNFAKREGPDSVTSPESKRLRYSFGWRRATGGGSWDFRRFVPAGLVVPEDLR